MRRHVIVGRFGALDGAPVPTADDEVATELDLVASRRRLDHGLGQALDDLSALSLHPTELGLDLAVLAALVHAADTRISRETESQDTWTREIRLVVPVSDPRQWIAAAGLLKRMLDFLTGDRWIIGFRPRPVAFNRIVRRRRGHAAPEYDCVSLFSGGLDSLIGAIDVVHAGATPLFVSHAGDGATSAAQNACFQPLRDEYSPQRLDRVRVWMTFSTDLVRGVASEKSTRGRSFLFFALGVLAGTGLADAFTLRAPENGLIALNVPLDVLRLGSNSTRTTHPFYVRCWNELLDVLGIRGRIENPDWNRTKGEMVAGCVNEALLRRVAADALSCSSPTKGRWRGHGMEHCGYCLPCLIRRAAIQASWGRGADPTRYTLANLRGRPLDTRKAEGEHIRSLEGAIARLRAHPEQAHLLIHKPGPLPRDPDHLNALADVYRRGLAEVGSLLAGVRAKPS